MAITKEGLSAAMLSSLTAAIPISTPTKMCDALAEAIVDYLKANAEIDPLTGSPPMTVVVLGAPTPVTGKGRIT